MYIAECYDTTGQFYDKLLFCNQVCFPGLKIWFAMRGFTNYFPVTPSWGGGTGVCGGWAAFLPINHAGLSGYSWGSNITQ